MPDSSSPPITQTLPNEFALVETWIDGLSNGEATILGFILVTIAGLIGWLFTRKKDNNHTINIHPQIIVENPKSQLLADPVTPETPKPKIHSDRLPTVEGKFFGREVEVKLLDEAWAGDRTHIIQFIAPGGTGKTKLLRHWLDHTNDIDTLMALVVLFTRIERGQASFRVAIFQPCVWKTRFNPLFVFICHRRR